MSRYLINNILMEKGSPDFTAALTSAYRSKPGPLCLCKNPGVPMYIAKHGDSFIIKRMPNAGGDHHPDCDSYEIPSELSGRGAVVNKAISEDQETGITNLKLDFSLSKMSVNRAANKGEASEKTTVSADPAKLSLRSLLHYIYEEAALNKWTPNMEGKRNWYVIRKHLLQAAQNKVAKKNQIVESLLIPETFSVEQKDAIAARRRQFLGKLKGKSNKQPMGILIGEVKDITEARFGFKLIVKHMPDTSIYMGEEVYKRINKHFATELALFEEDESVHLLTICTFYLSASGNPQIDSISFMLTDRNWLPVEGIEDVELVERLVTGKKHFIKGLRYNLSSSEVIASALLTDVRGGPTALYMIPVDAGETYYESLNAVTEVSDLQSCIWDLNSEEPLQLP